VYSVVNAFAPRTVFSIVRRELVIVAILLLLAPAPVRASGPVDVRFVADEAEAVLAILEKRAAGRPIAEADWRRLFASEGYVRLEKREASMKRDIDRAEFRAFVLSDALAARGPALRDTLARWRRADTTGAARRALAYLPKGARIRAKLYPVIKPRDNTFVFETKTDPAIFLYLDPAVTPEQLENTVAHELHHIGFGGSCLPDGETRPKRTQAVLDWSGALGEGLAMLAAAGGPSVHPHAVSKAEDRARWDRDVANYRDDFAKVERFFVDMLEGRLDGEEQQNEVGFSFFGVQGPWYTVGWKMAVTIERAYGRDALIACFCDRTRLFETYNRAVAKSGEPLPVWSAPLVAATSGRAS
jgi:hypothetical protein